MGLQPGVGPTIAAPRARAASDVPPPNALQTVYGAQLFGTDGQVLTSDSAQPLGLGWANPSSIIPSGVVFPVAPIDGQSFLRTDLDILFEWKTALNSWKPLNGSVEQVIKALAPDSFWKLDEIAGNYGDSGAAGIAAAPVSGSRGVKGYRGSLGVSEPGDTAVATAGDNYRFANRAAFTVLALHKPSTFATVARRLVMKGDNGSLTGWQLCWNQPNGEAFFFRNPAGIAAISDFGASLAEWNLVAGIYDGGSIGTFLNGVYKLSTADANNVNADANLLRINGLTGDTAPRGAVGVYDCVAIWSRALSATELGFIWAAM